VADRSSLSASWLGTRWGVDPVAVDVRRRAGEVVAAREQGSEEWHYPVWQFDEAGNVRPEVAHVLAAAREAGVKPAELAALFNRRLGLSGRRTMLDALLEGDERPLLGELRKP
jgi:hypothetical protein